MVVSIKLLCLIIFVYLSYNTLESMPFNVRGIFAKKYTGKVSLRLDVHILSMNNSIFDMCFI